MKISELIDQLQAFQGTHGDVEVIVIAGEGSDNRYPVKCIWAAKAEANPPNVYLDAYLEEADLAHCNHDVYMGVTHVKKEKPPDLKNGRIPLAECEGILGEILSWLQPWNLRKKR